MLICICGSSRNVGESGGGGVVVVVVVCGSEEQIDKYTGYCLVYLVEMQDYNVNVTVALTPQEH